MVVSTRWKMILVLSAACWFALAAVSCVNDSQGGPANEPTDGLPPAKLTGEALTPPTTTPIPWVGPECPVEESVCEAALVVAGIVSQQDLIRLAALLEPTIVTCTKELLLATGPVCREDNIGREVDGVGWFIKQAQLLPPSQLVEGLSARWSEHRAAASERRILVGCPDERASDCSSFFAVSFPAEEDDGPPMVFTLSRHGTAFGLVAVSLVPSGFHGAVAGGWANVGHPALDIPTMQWFIPWQAAPQ